MLYICMFPSITKINRVYRNFLRELLDERLVPSVQLLNSYRVAEVMQCSQGQLDSACKTGGKNHH